MQQLLGGNECQSQLILTTQELPGELESVGSRHPQRWCCEPIRGLSEAEQLELFAKRGVAEPDTDYLQRIGKLYDGHPLVLRVIAEDIKACGGTVQRYWQQGKFVELEANRPAQLSRRKLQLEVKQRVKLALDRLPADSVQLLCRSAVYRRSVPPSFWLAMLPERSHSEAALELLKARGLAEEEWEEGAWLGADGEIPLRQHNLIRSVAYERLKADEAIWQAAERTAAEQWLNHYEAVPEAANLEQVRGYLEAFDHCCDVKDYQIARKIPYRLLDTKNEVYWQLFIWGYYQELIPLHNKLLFVAREISDRPEEGNALRNLGLAYRHLDNYPQAIEFHQQALVISHEIGDQEGQASDLSNLGTVHYNLGNHLKAIEFHQQALVISRKTGNRQGEASDLGNLGLAYYNLGNYSQAIESYQQFLAISREIGDRRSEGDALDMLGGYYDSLGNYPQAIEFHQQALVVSREIGNRLREGSALYHLGLVHYNLGNYLQAIEFHQQALVINREIGNRRGEGSALGGLGDVYYSLGNYPQAIEFQQQYLAISREIGDPQGEGNALGDLGINFMKLERYLEALENFQLVLKIFKQTGHRAAEAKVLKCLAELHQKLGENDRALEYCDRALAIATELGIPLVKECEDLRELLISSIL